MKKRWLMLVLCALSFGMAWYIPPADDWGFFGHRRINRLAVFTLPPEMISFYKKHVDYITEHSVDPDKRRYATRHEAVRHYIDLDIWGKAPYTNVPRDWTSVLTCYSSVYAVLNNGEKIQIYKAGDFDGRGDTIVMKYRQNTLKTPYKDYRNFFREHIQPQYYEDDWVLEASIFCEQFQGIGPCRNIERFEWKDEFSEHGILPYHLEWMQNRLTDAFRRGDELQILRLSTEFGHYIGDAHVPLHTTVNYNGQLTNQDGIHAFWESRIPELFADAQFDFFVGPAEYIDNPRDYFWNAILKAHSYVDTVLAIELELRNTFPVDLQFCYDERLGRVVRTQCREFAEAYHEALKGQVEQQFRASIVAIGSVWYTAWVDAGQPDLRRLKGSMDVKEADQQRQQELEVMFQKGEVKGREHEN